jgi:hypothetical protein
MNYSRPMIDLVYEIRRRVPSHLKPDIKLANPELLDILLLIAQETRDAIVQALIKELLALAGSEWIVEVKKPHSTELTANQQHHHGSDALAKPQRIYRGQIIEDL